MIPKMEKGDDIMKTKMTALFATLMITLMLAGFAYAHWEKIVTINGTVNTGTLHLYPTFSATTDDTKEICTVTGVIVDNTLTVTIDKAYPCITVSGYFDFHNDGTIPAALKDVIVTPLAGVTYTYDPVTKAFTISEGTTVIATGTLTWARWAGFPQLDPGDTAYVDFTLHFEEGLPQIKTYKFTVEAIFWNWNEVIK